MFGPEHEELKRNAKRFIQAEINPHVDAWEEAGTFPAHEVFRGLGKLGLLGINKPAEYGGLALDYSYALRVSSSCSGPNIVSPRDVPPRIAPAAGRGCAPARRFRAPAPARRACRAGR